MESILDQKIIESNNLIIMEIKGYETRVKRYKSYRISIKKQYESINKSKNKNDQLKQIEKKIKKINPSLLINHDHYDPFAKSYFNENEELNYINELSFLINQLQENKYAQLINKTKNVNDEIENEPTFDEKGKVNNVWLNEDSKYKELNLIKDWIYFVAFNEINIERKIKQKVFIFKDALQKTKNKDFLEKFLKINTKKLNFKRNENNLIILNIIKTIALFFALITFLLIILFLSGV